jgi:3-carboxy-cis,cis-muconate cycloisomerase
LSLEPPGGLFDSLFASDGVLRATGDGGVVQALLDVEAALARASAACGVVPAEHAATIAAACDEGAAAFDAVALGREARLGGNPVIPLVAALRRLLPDDVAGSVHYGATSQDVVDSAMMLVARRSLGLIGADLSIAAEAAVALAEQHRDTVQLARTLLQPALPTTFGLRAAGWSNALLDRAGRLRALDTRLPAQLGGAAGTLASFGDAGLAVRRRFASELGLAVTAMPWHADRQIVADLGGALAGVCGVLGKVARDVLLLSMAEVGEVREPLATGRGGSSTLPQKHNAVLSTLIAANARRAPALASVLLGGLDGELDRAAGAWHAEWLTSIELLRAAGGSAAAGAALLSGLEVDAGAMAAHVAATGGLVLAERVRIAFAAEVGSAEAGTLVARAVDGAGIFADEVRAIVAGDPRLAGVDAEALLEPRSYLGSAGAFVDAVVARHRAGPPA